MIGKTQASYLKEGMAAYSQRLTHYTQLQIIEIPAIKNSGSWSEEKLKNVEGEQLLAQLSGEEYLVLLDERGKMRNSSQFAEWIAGHQNRCLRHLAFMVGGAYGFSDALYAVGKEKFSLSAMTFSHQILRLIFLEQLYRAYSILNNHPYHHN